MLLDVRPETVDTVRNAQCLAGRSFGCLIEISGRFALMFVDGRQNSRCTSSNSSVAWEDVDVG